MDNTNTVDWGLVISIIALVSSILSPVLVTVCNNLHASYMWKLENGRKHKVDVYEQYIRGVGGFFQAGGIDMAEDFGKNSHLIFLYAPMNLWKLIRQVNSAVSEHRRDDETRDKIEQLCQKLGKDLGHTR